MRFPVTFGAFDANIPKLGSAVLSIGFLASGDRENDSTDPEDSEYDEDDDEEEDAEEEQESSDSDSDYIPEANSNSNESKETTDSDPFAVPDTKVFHPITPPGDSVPTPFGFFNYMLFSRNTGIEPIPEPIIIDNEESTLCDDDDETDGEDEIQEELKEDRNETNTKTLSIIPVLYDEDSKGDEDEPEVVFEADVTSVCRSWATDKKRTSELRELLPFILRDAIDCGAVITLDVEVLLNVKLALRYTDGSEVVIEIDRKGWVKTPKNEKPKEE